jgi:ADP-heptose:LPS heptosyltransferase
MLYVLLTYLCWPLLCLSPRRRVAASPRRFLVVQTAKIGDLVYATPLWRAIRAAHPRAHVALLAHPAAAALVAHDRALDAVHTVDAAALRGPAGKWRLARLVRRGRYDVALCLTPSLGLAVGLLWGLVPRVVLLVPDTAGATFRALARLAARAGHRRGEPLSTAYLRMMAAAGLAGDMRARALAPAPGAEGRVREFLASRGVPPGTALVGIVAAAGNPAKQWLPDRVAALADRIAGQAGARVLLIGSAADRPLVEGILGRMETPAVDAAGALALGDLPALLTGLTLLVAADSGPLHIAEAVGVPAVIIGGPADLRERDLRTPHRLVQQHLPCLPCVSAFKAPYACPLGHHRCIGDTQVEEVWEAVRAMLDGVAHAQRLAVEAGPMARANDP